MRTACQGNRTCQPHFKWHVEPCGLTGSAEIMDRHLAGAKQFVNASQPALAPLANLKHTAWHLSQGNEGADESHEVRLVRGIEGDVQEDPPEIARWQGHSAGVAALRLSGKCSLKSLLGRPDVRGAYSHRTANLAGRCSREMDLAGAQASWFALSGGRGRQGEIGR